MTSNFKDGGDEALKTLIPLIRKVAPATIAEQILGVQPMLSTSTTCRLLIAAIKEVSDKMDSHIERLTTLGLDEMVEDLRRMKVINEAATEYLTKIVESDPKMTIGAIEPPSLPQMGLGAQRVYSIPKLFKFTP